MSTASCSQCPELQFLTLLSTHTHIDVCIYICIYVEILNHLPIQFLRKYFLSACSKCQSVSSLMPLPGQLLLPPLLPPSAPRGPVCRPAGLHSPCISPHVLLLPSAPFGESRKSLPLIMFKNSCGASKSRIFVVCAEE